MTAKLVPWPRAAALTIAASVAVVTALGVLVHDDAHGNWFDNGVLRVIQDVVPDWLQGLGLHLTDPPVVIGALACVVLFGAATRRWDVVALAIMAPALTVVLNEDVLKPLVHRSNVIVTDRLGEPHALAYPSGHEAGLAGAVCVLGLLVLASSLRAAHKLLCTALLALVLIAGAVGLVGHFFHYATDTIGAFGVALALTLAVGLAIDVCRSPRRRVSVTSDRHRAEA